MSSSCYAYRIFKHENFLLLQFKFGLKPAISFVNKTASERVMFSQTPAKTDLHSILHFFGVAPEKWIRKEFGGVRKEIRFY